MQRRSLGDIFNDLSSHTSAARPNEDDIPLMKWHLSLNHMPTKALQKLSKNPKFRKLLSTIKRYKKLTCSGCADGKAHKAPHPRKEHKARPGEILSVDTVGPHDHSHDSNTTLLTIVDATTRYCTSIPKSSRALAKAHIKRIMNECAHLHGTFPRILIADTQRSLLGKI